MKTVKLTDEIGNVITFTDAVYVPATKDNEWSGMISGKWNGKGDVTMYFTGKADKVEIIND